VGVGRAFGAGAAAVLSAAARAYGEGGVACRRLGGAPLRARQATQGVARPAAGGSKRACGRAASRGAGHVGANNGARDNCACGRTAQVRTETTALEVVCQSPCLPSETSHAQNTAGARPTRKASAPFRGRGGWVGGWRAPNRRPSAKPRVGGAKTLRARHMRPIRQRIGQTWSNGKPRELGGGPASRGGAIQGTGNRQQQKTIGDGSINAGARTQGDTYNQNGRNQRRARARARPGFGRRNRRSASMRRAWGVRGS
jgi:hypothetical protein